MSQRSAIEWTDATWNPTRGCSRVSPGCERCYAERVAGRFGGTGQPYEGLVRKTPTGYRWTGEARLVPEKLAEPLRWRTPRRVFVDSMSDLFHEKLSNEDIAAVFGVMAAATQHTFQVLTKRPERMREWFAWADGQGHRSPCLREAYLHLAGNNRGDIVADRLAAVADGAWPLPNVWLGVSVEDQATADERIPLLLETPAAVRFVSYEPAIGPVDLSKLRSPFYEHGPGSTGREVYPLDGMMAIPDCDWNVPRIDWVIAGSESGPRARPAELDWFRRVRDQCAAAGVAYFFKQWVGDAGLREPGSLEPGVMRPPLHRRGGVVSLPVLDDRQHAEFPR